MKLHGVEGMSPENIRDEVHRGGRLVIYSYCVSLLVLTLKRPTAIRLIRAGHSPVGAGLPFVGVSLLCGWWGFPWGPIYTVETIYRNLSGGTDVTDAVLRQLLPADAAGAARPAMPTTFATTPAPGRRFNLRIAATMALSVIALIAGGIAIYCYQQEQNLTVALVSGLDEPYAVTLNGTSHHLKPHGAEVLSLPEGDFVLQDAPGGHVVGAPRTFHFGVPLFSHLDAEHVAVINPDATAVLLNEEVHYSSDQSAPPSGEEPVFTMMANQQSYFLAKPDFVIEPAPEHISMPSGTTRLVKTRLELEREADLSWILESLGAKRGYPAVREHVMILARHRSDEAFLAAATDALKPADLRAFFLTHLPDRPVLVEWHRHYQAAMEYTDPTRDLLAEYRGYVQAEPGNGALLYLLGRLSSDNDEAHRLWLQALAAQPPCAYALAALGFDDLSEARFEQALSQLIAAEKAGIAGSSRRRYIRQILLALGRFDPLLDELRVARKADPLSIELAGDQINAVIAAGQGADAAIKLKAAYLAAYKASRASSNSLADADAYLQSIIDYQTGHLIDYAARISRFDAPFYKFRAAVSLGDLKAAAAIVRGDNHPRSSQLLLLYLMAKLSGDEAQAEAHFNRAVELMALEPHLYRRAAELLTRAQRDPLGICQLHLDVEDKRILLTALGLHDPANRAVYHELAAKLNYSPDFPQQFLRGFFPLAQRL